MNSREPVITPPYGRVIIPKLRVIRDIESCILFAVKPQNRFDSCN